MKARFLVATASLVLALSAQAAKPLELTLSKPEQHRLNVLTQRPHSQADAWLAARVVADPSRRWLAMADQAGVIEAPEQGFTKPGEPVKAGQVLAWLRPSLTESELRDLQSQRRVVQRDYELAEIQLKRFDIDAAQAIDVNLPTPSIQIVADFQAAQARATALDELLGGRIAVRVPVSGVLLENRARSQKVAAAGESLFEGSGDAALAVELIAAQDTLAPTAQLRTQNAVLANLQRLSASYDASLRSWRLLYGLSESKLARVLLPGEPVQLRLAASAPSLSLPRSSIFRRQGQTWVWVHEDAERFVAHPVRLGTSDGLQQSVLEGIGAQDRVVIDAQALQPRIAAIK